MNPEKFQLTDQSNNATIESSHHEKREEIYDQMHERVQSVKEVRAFVDENKDLPVAEFEEVCEEWLREFLTTMPRLSVQDLQDVENYTPGYVDLNEIKDEYERYSAQAQRSKWHKTDDGGVISNDDVLRVRRSHILAYEAALKDFGIDKLLALEMSRFISHVIKRKKDAQNRKDLYCGDPHTFFDSTLLKGVYNKDQVASIDVDFSGLNTNIILDDTFYNIVEEKTGQKKNKTDGLHAVGTVINFIRKGDGQEETIQHEENHTVSECFVNKIRKSEFALQTTVLIVDYEAALSDTSHTSQEKEIIVRQKKKELGDFVRWYADRNTNELVADIDSLAEGKVTTFLNDFASDREYLQVLIEQQNDEEIITTLKRNLVENDTQFVDYMSRLSDLFFGAKRMGHVEDIKAAVILFKPHQIRHIERYAQDLYGKEEYELNTQLRPLLCNGSYFESINYHDPRKYHLQNESDTNSILEELAQHDAVESFFSIENITHTNELLRGHGTALTERERSKVEELLLAKDDTKINYSDIFNKNSVSNDITWVASLDEQLKIMGELLNIKGFDHFVEDHLSPVYARMTLYGVSQFKNVQSLREAFDQWPMSMEALRRNYLQLLENGEVTMQCQGNERLTMDDYLTFLASIGFKEDEIQESVNKCDELFGEMPDDQKKVA